MIENNKQSAGDLDALQSLMASMTSNIEFQTGEFRPDPNKIIYLTDRNGVWQIRETKLARFFIQESKHNIPYLPAIVTSPIELKIPKVPQKVYFDLLAYYRLVYSQWGSEVGAYIMYDPETQTFFPFIQKQIIGPGETTFDPNDPEIREMCSRYIAVLETHSHHTMSGAFSGQDTRVQNELNAINLVIGRINTNNPEYEMRFCLGDKKVNLELKDVFDIPVVEFNLAYSNWKERCSTRSEIEKNKKKSQEQKKDGKLAIPSENVIKQAIETCKSGKRPREARKAVEPFTRLNHDMLNSKFEYEL